MVCHNIPDIIDTSIPLQYKQEFVLRNKSRCKSPNYTIIDDYSGSKNFSENATGYCLAKPLIWIYTAQHATLKKKKNKRNKILILFIDI